MQAVATVTLVVRDYDAAIAFYREKLGFELLADTPLGGGKRWVTVAPKGNGGAKLLLALADGAAQAAHVGNQTGGRVAFFSRPMILPETMPPTGQLACGFAKRRGTSPMARWPCSRIFTAIAGT